MSAPDTDCRVEKQPSRLAHNQEIAGASPAPATNSEPAGLAVARGDGWIKVDDQTLLMLRLLAGERGCTVPALIGALAREQFPVWFDDGEPETKVWRGHD